MKNKKIFSIAALVMIVICLIIAAFFVGKMIKEAREYSNGNEIYEEIIDNAVETVDADTDKDKTEESTSTEEISQEHTKLENESMNVEHVDSVSCPKIDFRKLKMMNPDIVAWVYCPGTEINYPVVQGDDNSFYLTHLADGTQNKNGSLFVEVRNKYDFSDDNTIIYGHNMASGKMLAGLIDYRSQEFYAAHPFMYLVTENSSYRLELFSGFTTKPDSDAYTISCGNSKEFATWIKDMASRSDFKVNMKMTTNDRIVTLSTCSYSFKNARYVVMGRLVELEE